MDYNASMLSSLEGVELLASSLDKAQLQRLADAAEVVNAFKGERIIQQGDVGDAMYVLESGRLEVSVVTAKGEDLGVVREYRGRTLLGRLARKRG